MRSTFLFSGQNRHLVGVRNKTFLESQKLTTDQQQIEKSISGSGVVEKRSGRAQEVFLMILLFRSD